MSQHDVPAGFLPLNSSSPFNNLVGPYYACLLNEQICVGIRLDEKHCNTSGRLHGAMVAAIFDVVLGHNVGLELAKNNGEDITQYAAGVPNTPLVTATLTTDYMGTASIGDWLTATATVQRPGKSLAYVNAELFNADTRIAKATGIYRVFT